MVGIPLVLVLVLLVGQSPAEDPARLVGRLGSPRYAERAAAAAALESMGLAALPALRAAADAKDPELRTRAAAVADRIERNERDRPRAAEVEPPAPDRPSMVRLDFAARSLDSVLAGFGSPSPGRLAWHPDTPEEVRRRPITLREPSPLPFWAAVDRLCRAGGLRYIPGSPGGRGDHRAPEHRLFLAPGTWDAPRADSGPLRLELVAIDHSRHVNLIPNRPGDHPGRGPVPQPSGGRQEGFRIELRLLAEPRMLIDQVGDALIAEAVDDRGQSLLPGPAPYLHYYGYGFGGQPQASGPYMLSLKYPRRAGIAIKRLKLTIAVGVESPLRDRLEIRLADAMGKTIRHGPTSIEVLSVGADSQGHQRVKLKLRSEEVVPVRLTPGPDGKPASGASRPAFLEVTPNVIQVLDRQGRQFPWLVGDSRGKDAEMTVELLMWPEGGVEIPVPAGHGIVPPGDRDTAVPAVLYHTGVARRIISGTFEFHDIPLP